MGITARAQAVTTEDKLTKTLEILAKMHSQYDAEFLRGFILELCQRYCNNIDEMKQLNISDAVKGFNEFEAEYMKRIIKEFSV